MVDSSIESTDTHSAERGGEWARDCQWDTYVGQVNFGVDLFLQVFLLFYKIVLTNVAILARILCHD